MENMMKKLCLLFSTLSSLCFANLYYGSDWIYQDILVNDQVLRKGSGPDCASRYEALKPILDSFDRPFTVLDIGANNGYFSLRIARDYNATCVLIDTTDRLTEICTCNTELDRLVYLKKYLRLQDIQQLSQLEHFDVILIFHVLHHVDSWHGFLEALFRMGDHVIIETPPYNDTSLCAKPTIPAIEHYLLQKEEGRIIAKTPRYAPDTFANMFWFPPKNVPKPRQPGIRLSTYRSFGGAYPTDEMISPQISSLGPVPEEHLFIEGNHLSLDTQHSH
jgi:SAM-dependent methyltransferase